MGVYTQHQIKNDFRIAGKGILSRHIRNVEIIAEQIIEEVPDNKAKDIAISNLLKAVEMLALSYIFHNQKIHPTEKSG